MSNDQHPNPTQGGSYTRNPVTGALEQTAGTAAAPQALNAAAAANVPAQEPAQPAPAATPTEA